MGRLDHPFWRKMPHYSWICTLVFLFSMLPPRVPCAKVSSLVQSSSANLNSDRRLYQDEIEELVGEMTAYISNNLEHSLRGGNSSTLKFVFRPDHWKADLLAHQVEPNSLAEAPPPVLKDTVNSLLVYVPSTTTASPTTTISTSVAPLIASSWPELVSHVGIKKWSRPHQSWTTNQQPGPHSGTTPSSLKTHHRKTSAPNQIGVPSKAKISKDPFQLGGASHSFYMQQLAWQQQQSQKDNPSRDGVWIYQPPEGIPTGNALGRDPEITQISPVELWTTPRPTPMLQPTRVPFLGTPFARPIATRFSTWSPYRPTSHPPPSHMDDDMHRNPQFRPTVRVSNELWQRPDKPYPPGMPMLPNDFQSIPHPSDSIESPNAWATTTIGPIKSYKPTVPGMANVASQPQGSNSIYKTTVKAPGADAAFTSAKMEQPSTLAGPTAQPLSTPSSPQIPGPTTYKPTMRPSPIITTSGFILPPSTSTSGPSPAASATLSGSTQRTVDTTMASQHSTTTYSSPQNSEGLVTVKPNQVVEVNVYQLVEQFVFAFDNFVKRLLGGSLGKTVDVLSSALRQTFNGRNSVVNLLIVFGIPVATAVLTFVGAGPLSVAMAAWLIPVAAVLIIPDILTNNDLDPRWALLE